MVTFVNVQLYFNILLLSYKVVCHTENMCIDFIVTDGYLKVQCTKFG